MLTGYIGRSWYPATVQVAKYGGRLLVDTSDVRQREFLGYTHVAMRLNLPHETRFGHITVGDFDLDDETRPTLPCDGIDLWDDGQVLWTTNVGYNGNGLVNVGGLNQVGINDVVSNVDLLNTTFCSEGVEFDTLIPNLIVGDFANVSRDGKQFWMSVMHVAEGVAPGISPAAQRMLLDVAPPQPLGPGDHGQDAPVGGAIRMEQDLPAVNARANVGDEGVGSVPLHEVVASMDAKTIISALSANPEVAMAVRNAFSKSKPGASGDYDVSGSGKPTGTQNTAETSSRGDT